MKERDPAINFAVSASEYLFDAGSDQRRQQLLQAVVAVIDIDIDKAKDDKEIRRSLRIARGMTISVCSFSFCACYGFGKMRLHRTISLFGSCGYCIVMSRSRYNCGGFVCR